MEEEFKQTNTHGNKGAAGKSYRLGLPNSQLQLPSIQLLHPSSALTRCEQNSNKRSGSVPGIDNAICSLNKAGRRPINSGQCSGFYSLPWSMLMDIDSDLRGAKSWAWRVLISGEQIKLAASGQRRVWIYLSWSSMIYESQREADSCWDEPDPEKALHAAQRKSQALFMFYHIFAFTMSEAAVFTQIIISECQGSTTSRANYVANAMIFLCFATQGLAGVKSRISFPAEFQPAFSSTLGTAINPSDWLRSGSRLRSSPEAPWILPWRETKMFRSLRLELSRGPKCVNSW